MISEIVIFGLIGYLVGALPVAGLVARGNGLDLGGAGARVESVAWIRERLGLGWAVLVLALEAIKASVPIAATAALRGDDWAGYVAVCVMAGQAWPVFSGTRVLQRGWAGRGSAALTVSAVAAAAVLLSHEAAVLAFFAGPIVLAVRNNAMSAMIVGVLLPIAAALGGEPRPVILAFAAIAYILVVQNLGVARRAK